MTLSQGYDAMIRSGRAVASPPTHWRIVVCPPPRIPHRRQMLCWNLSRTLRAPVVTGRPLHFSSNKGKRTESRTLGIMGCGDVGRLNLRPTAQLEAFCHVQSWWRWIGVSLADSAQIDALGVVRSDLRWRLGSAQRALRADSRPR